MKVIGKGKEFQKKYDMIPTEVEGIFRIRAIRDIPEKGVRKGEWGGLIEKEYNLDQAYDCWIWYGAKVTGNARVTHDVEIRDTAKISGFANIYYEAKITGNAEVYDKATITGNAIAEGNAKIYGSAKLDDYAVVTDNAEVRGNAIVRKHATVTRNAKVGGNAEVTGYAIVRNDEEITQDTISVSFAFDTITLEGNYINIGHESKTADEWLKHIEKSGIHFIYSKEKTKDFVETIKWMKTIQDSRNA